MATGTRVSPEIRRVAADSFKAQAPLEGSTAVVQLRDVSVFYGEKLAVRDVKIDVQQNRITAFIGPSG